MSGREKHTKKAKEARGHKEKGDEVAATGSRDTPEQEAPEPFENTTLAPIRTKVVPIPPLVTQERSPPTLSPVESHRGPGKSDSGKTVVGDGYHRGGKSRNSSRMFPSPIIFWRLMTSRTGVDLPNSPSRGQLAQSNKSSASVLPTPLGSWSE